MKHVFILLLLVNFLVYLGARHLAPPVADESERRTGGTLEFLLPEKPAPKPEPVIVAPPGPLTVAPALGTAATDADRTPGDQGYGRVVTAESSEEGGDAERADRGAPADPAPETPPEAAETAQSPASGNQGDGPGQDAGIPELAEGECLTLGPLPTRARADQLARDLAQQNMAAMLRTDIKMETRSYFVLVADGPEVGALQIMRDLREAGYRDVWQLTSGEHKDRVSVGLFRSRTNADARRLQVGADGFSASVVPRVSEQRFYWVDLRYEPSRRFTAELLDALVPSYPGVSAERKRCIRAPL